MGVLDLLYEQEYPEENAVMAGFAERFREEGMQQSERVVLERQLQRRFGPLKPELLKKPEQASTSELEQLAAKHYL